MNYIKYPGIDNGNILNLNIIYLNLFFMSVISLKDLSLLINLIGKNYLSNSNLNVLVIIFY